MVGVLCRKERSSIYFQLLILWWFVNQVFLPFIGILYALVHMTLVVCLLSCPNKYLPWPLSWNLVQVWYVLVFLFSNFLWFTWDVSWWGLDLNPGWLSEERNLRCLQCQSFTSYDYIARAAWIQMGGPGGYQQARTLRLPFQRPSRKRDCS